MHIWLHMWKTNPKLQATRLNPPLSLLSLQHHGSNVFCHHRRSSPSSQLKFTKYCTIVLLKTALRCSQKQGGEDVFSPATSIMWRIRLKIVGARYRSVLKSSSSQNLPKFVFIWHARKNIAIKYANLACGILRWSRNAR